MARESNDEKELSHRLKRALSTGDVTAFKRLVKGGVDVTAKYWVIFRQYDSTLLHEAVTIGNPEIVAILLQYKAKVNATNKDGRTPLHIATRAGNLEIVNSLLKAGADINQQTSDGKTALHIAVWRAKYDVVEKLLREGARTDIPDKDGWLPIHWAAKLNHSRAVKQLVEKEALLDSKISKVGLTPFQQAVQNSNLELAEYLLLHGANVQITIKGQSAAFCLTKDKHLSGKQIMDTVDLFIQNGYIVQNDDWFSVLKFYAVHPDPND